MHLLSLLILLPLTLAHQSPLAAIDATGLTVNSIPYSTRVHWMRKANEALSLLSSPCPFAAFGTVIVNHTAVTPDGLGELVCIGINENSKTGNPTLHGEIAAIANCTTILTVPSGRYNFTASQAQSAFSSLSLYTNAESCPMCASAIRWAGFKEYVYGTSIDTLVQRGWGQIRISSYEIFKESGDLPSRTKLIANVAVNETDPFFLWQYDPAYPCPAGCQRGAQGGCTVV
ncbi:guanine deaminase [Aureobasidium pullulans]|nr:guanine deaminase [Aureobasidium pullulans]